MRAHLGNRETEKDICTLHTPGSMTFHYTDNQAERQTGRETNRQVDIQTGRKVDRHTDRQTDM